MDRSELYACMEAAASLYVDCLGKNYLALDYLTERGLIHPTLETFKIGYSPKTNIFIEQMNKYGFSIQSLLQCGLIKPWESTYSGLFAGRIVFPIRDVLGRIVSFGGRWFYNDNKDRPKYVNGRQTPIYKKGEYLYGLFEALTAIKEKQRVVVVEGYTDVTAMHQGGFRETVGVCGTSFTEFQIYLLKLLGVKIIGLFDGDMAGNKASEKFEQLAKKHHAKYKVVNLNSIDPADLVTLHGPRAIEGLL